MPFDFKKYDAKCATLDGNALQLEWEHYTRLISGAATSTAISGAAIPFTFGVSSIGVGLAAPSIHNARKKREIIERHLQRVGRTHHTRKRDVIGAGAISGTVGVVTLGLAPIGADAICSSAAGHGIAYIAENELAVKVTTHLALDAAAVVAEEHHMGGKKEREAWRAFSSRLSKAGQAVSVPDSDPKTATAIHQASFHGTRQQSLSQNTSAGQNIPPPVQQASTEAAGLYFPPPPSWTDIESQDSYYRRHSVSTLSQSAQVAPAKQSLLPPDTRSVYSTTTAISTPMTGGQSFPSQTQRRSDVDFQDKSTLSFAQSTSIVQPYHETMNRHSEGHFSISSSRLSPQPNDKHTGYVNNALHKYSPLPSPSPPASVSLLPPPPPYTPTASINLGDRSPLCPQYSPGCHTQASRQALKAPTATVHSLHSTSSWTDSQKGPRIYQYELEAPVEKATVPCFGRLVSKGANASILHVPSEPQQDSSGLSLKGGVRPSLYFPPPPLTVR